MHPELGAQQFLIAAPYWVAEPQPHEMSQLVDEDPVELAARAVESDAPLSQERSGMYRPATPA